MHPASQLSAHEEEAGAEGGTLWAGSNVSERDTSCPPVSQSSEKNAGAGRSDACGFDHTASHPPRQRRPSVNNSSKYTDQATTQNRKENKGFTTNNCLEFVHHH